MRKSQRRNTGAFRQMRDSINDTHEVIDLLRSSRELREKSRMRSDELNHILANSQRVSRLLDDLRSTHPDSPEHKRIQQKLNWFNGRGYRIWLAFSVWFRSALRTFWFEVGMACLIPLKFLIFVLCYTAAGLALFYFLIVILPELL